MNLEEAFREAAVRIGDPNTLVRAVLSGRRRNMEPGSSRIDIKPVALKGTLHLQVMSNDGIKTTTKNYLPKDFDSEEFLRSGFANILVESTEEALTLRITKKNEPLFHLARSAKVQDLAHDRKKNRLLQPSDPFLKEIGISDQSGQVKPSRQDKFRQVEEFLRILAPTLANAVEAGHIDQPVGDQKLEIVDLGCGHAYLTFAAHQYLRSEGFPIHLLGIDVREESRVRNSEIAKKLGIESSIEFRAERIADYAQESVDIAIALHACDTATDDSLAWAIQRGAKIILAAPCCHHDLQTQMKANSPEWSLVTKYGLLNERLGDILTDALRAHILRMLGYRVDTIEFVGGEHTPRNLMIRAVKTDAPVDPIDFQKYLELTREWNVLPALEVRLAVEFAKFGLIRS